jgi:hypothetical protein
MLTTSLQAEESPGISASWEARSGAAASTMRRRSALDPTSIAAKRGISPSQPNGAFAGKLAHMYGVHRIVTRTLARLLGVGLGLATPGALSLGCAVEPPRAAHPLSPIPEPRARDLIGRTFRAAGVPVEANRFVRVGSATSDDKRVRLEIAAAGRKFGVAYLTPEDWAQLGDVLPPRASNGALVVARGEGGTRILCLFASDYADDDQTGDDRTATTVAADRRLERDVRDFLHRAEEQSWP